MEVDLAKEIQRRIKMLANVSMNKNNKEDFLQFCAMYMWQRKSYMIPRAILIAEYFRKYKKRFSTKERENKKADHSTFLPDAEFFVNGLVSVSGDEYDNESRTIGRSLFEKISSVLNKKERYIVEQLLKGSSCTDLAKEFGVSLSRISQIRAEIIRKCRAAGIITKGDKIAFTSFS